MAESPPENTPESNPESSSEQPLLIQTQYIKDLSFENPNAPGIYGILNKETPTLNITLDVQSRHLGARTYEVVLCLRVQTKTPETTAFLLELDYAGVVNVVDTIPEDEVLPLVMIEAPRHFFPFARSILATVTREGGFPPLIINPIDFKQFYAQRQKNAGQKNAAPENAAPA
jgi:preprotein translocase subunit SecB